MADNDTKIHPRWVKIFNAAVRIAQDEADAQRCKKKKWINTYLGSFVERAEPYRCLLDDDHEGECVFRLDAVVKTIAPSKDGF